MINLNVYRLSPDVKMPTYGTSMSACFDLCFCPTTDTVTGYDKNNQPITRELLPNKGAYIMGGERLLIPTGLVMKIRKHISVETFADITREHDELHQFSIRLHARSGMALKRGLVLANAEGIVDVDYQEQVFILMHNISETNQIIAYNERIAQGEVVVNEKVNILEVIERPKQYSERDGGFGSTGTDAPQQIQFGWSIDPKPKPFDNSILDEI